MTPKEKAMKYMTDKQNQLNRLEQLGFNHVEFAIDIALKEQAKEIKELINDAIRFTKRYNENTKNYECEMRLEDLLKELEKYT